MVIVVSNWRGEYEAVSLRFPQFAGGIFIFLPPPHQNHGGRAPTDCAPDIAPVFDFRRLFPGFIPTNLETELSGEHSDSGIRADDPRIFGRWWILHVGQLHFQRDLLPACRR